jgi:hypothetical protein
VKFVSSVKISRSNIAETVSRWKPSRSASCLID